MRRRTRPEAGGQERNVVTIVGAGIAGCSLAYELSCLGVRVRLLDAGSVGQRGASSVPAALLNPHRGRTGRARPDDLAGLAAFWSLTRRLEAEGLPSGAHRTGVLRVAASPRQADLWRSLDGVRWLEQDAMPDALHAPFGGMLVTQGGWAEPAILLHSLVHAAADRGAEVLEDTRVVRLAAGRLHTTRGTLPADRVVLCTGVERLPHLAIPAFSVVAGDAIALAWSGASLPPLAGAVNAAMKAHAIWVSGGHAIVPPGATASVGAGNGDDGDVPGADAQKRDRTMPQPAQAQEPDGDAEPLRAALAWSVPAVADAPVIGRWRRARARGSQPYPVIARVADHVTYYGSMAGRGFLCAADLSARLAAAIAAGRSDLPDA